MRGDTSGDMKWWMTAHDFLRGVSQNYTLRVSVRVLTWIKLLASSRGSLWTFWIRSVLATKIASHLRCTMWRSHVIVSNDSAVTDLGCSAGLGWAGDKDGNPEPTTERPATRISSSGRFIFGKVQWAPFPLYSHGSLLVSLR